MLEKCIQTRPSTPVKKCCRCLLSKRAVITSVKKYHK